MKLLNTRTNKMELYHIVNTLLFLFLTNISTHLIAQGGHDTKLIAGYTAKPLEARQGYIHIIDGIIYEAEVGITPFLSVGTGTIFFPWRGEFQNVGLKAKIASPVGKYVHIGVGTYVSRRFSRNNSNPGETTNITTGLVTIDLKWIQANFGAGFSTRVSYYQDEDKLGPAITFGMVVPLFKNIYLIGESWGVFYEDISIDTGYYLIAGLVLRWIPNRFSYELGVVGATGDNGDGSGKGFFPHVGVGFHF